jgi:hypothetical protein
MSWLQTFSKIAVFVMVTLGTTNVFAEGSSPSAKVLFETTSIAFGMGFSWGDGRLNYDGKVYGFSIDGVTLADIGISKASAAGTVYNLTDVTQFEGNYVAAEATFTMGGGMGGTTLRNQNGVVIHLLAISQGARLQLGASGMKIKLWSCC